MSFSALKTLIVAGREVLPLVEGGKGIAGSDGASSGAWAAANGVGTFSAVNPHIPGMESLAWSDSYSSQIRTERHKEMIERSIIGAIEQAKIAYETASNRGRIHMNVLWEMGGVEDILNGVLSRVKGLVHGVTCGAGMPFRLAEICAKHGVFYYPIVSSARAFGILWKRAYSKLAQWLGGVVYEDPWLAGGHNGISTNEDENIPEKPEPRVRSLRELMRSFGIADTIPIFVAGGVWCLSEWADWIDNPDLGAIAFQFGTRPLLTRESPIPNAWKKKLLTLKRGDIALNRFSPTGFPSSAVKNSFLQGLEARSERQIAFLNESDAVYSQGFPIGNKPNAVFLSLEDVEIAKQWISQGFSVPMKTPSRTLVFVTPEERDEIAYDRAHCIGCLSACKFSGWNQNPESPVKISPDPRSFCIQKSLQLISLKEDADHALMFCGHQGYRFAEDPFYQNDFIPTVQELIDRIVTGQ